MKIKQNEYVNHCQLTDILQNMAEDFPRFFTLESIGKSLEGRDIWAVTLTDKISGNHADKPAMLVDACIHAGEVTGTQVCLYLMDYMLNNRNDMEVSRIMEHRTVYIIPRINPDGAERFLSGEFESWGNLRPFGTDRKDEGLKRCDVDGNKMLLLMRVKDDNGEWKVSEKDSRLMIPRKPYEYGGIYYSIYPEGVLTGENVNTADFKVLPREYQLNMNRNYPEGWNIHTSLAEGGQYPLSEPETLAVANFVLSHKNIGTVQDLHTNGGVILRPYSYQSDQHFCGRDLEIFGQLAETAKETTGYDTVSVYESFATPHSEPRRGCFDDWAYESLGLLAVTTELWSLANIAGIKNEQGNYYPDQYKTEDEELAMLRWNDEHLNGDNFIDWQSFDHPQLGQLEIGGWNWKFTSKNPPIKYLEQECEKICQLCLKQVNMLPEIEVKRAVAKKIGDKLLDVSITVENRGFLPTYITDRAKELNLDRGVKVIIDNADEIKIIHGSKLSDAGDLEGRFRLDRNFYFGDPTEGIPRKTSTVCYVIDPRHSDALRFAVESEKAGRVYYELTL